MTNQEVKQEVMSALSILSLTAQEKYNISRENMLAVFAIGSMNYDCYDVENTEYGCYARHSNVDAICIVRNGKPTGKFNLEDSDADNSCTVVTLEEYIEKLIKQDINYLQTLTTKFFFINKDFEELYFDILRRRAETIARIDPINHMLNTIKIFAKDLETARKESRMSYHAFRLHSYLEDYYKGNTFRDCLIPLHSNKRQRIKRLRNGRRISRSEEKYLIKEVRRLRSKTNKWDVQKNENLIEVLRNSVKYFSLEN